MSSPNSKRSSSPASGTRRPTLRNRVGTLIRRASLLPSRSSSPSARSESEDPIAAAGKAIHSKGVSSRAASINSVESSQQQQPLAVPQAQEKPVVPKEEPKAEPAVAVEAPSPPVESPPVVAETAAESVPEAPAVAGEPVQKPTEEPTAAAVVVEEQKAADESYNPAYIPTANEKTLELEHREESRPASEDGHDREGQQEHSGQGQGGGAPLSDSPRSLSASLPSEDNGYQSMPTRSGETTPRTSSDEGHRPKLLSLNTSQDNLHHELSPIPEDPRSALEEKKAFDDEPQQQPNGLPPSGLSAPPINAPTLSEMSGGTTPRAVPLPLVSVEDVHPHPTDDKGKAKEANGHAEQKIEVLPHEDGYFTRLAPSGPMPIPQVSSGHYDVLEDPFKDPSPSTSHYESMPEPDTHSYNVSERHVTIEPGHPAPPATTMPEPAVYPLPSLNEVTAGNLRSMPSDYTLGAQSSRAPSIHIEVQTDETLPLLSGPKNVPTDGFKCSDAAYHDLHSAGWIAQSLPDSTTYYSHPRIRVTTDIDLENSRKLAAVMNYLEVRLAKEITLPADGLEIWLHDEAKSREEFVPVRCWVDHEARALGYWPPPTHRHEIATRGYGDDRLDYEYRYWAFLETHPAHVPLPANAYAEAWDKLTWSYTERLLKSNRRAPPPFTQHESEELLNILRSTSGSESSIQAAIQTRVVARIHRRVVQWKQHFFRPEKPLPRGVVNASSGNRNVPARKTFLDFILAWLCLGIPYLYANRHVYRFDEEGGIMRSAGPMLVVGATICIVAATIILASIALLALPGLDHAARTAGFISIIGSIASLLATLIAAFRNNVEIQRMAQRGGEGLVVTMSALTGDSILPSLPAVFLVWSLLSLVTGVVLYAFRGSVVIDTTHWAKFASFTRWTTIGVVTFCGGALIVSTFAIRR